MAWCEDLTLIAQHGTPEADYQKPEQAFTLAEVVALTLAIVAING